MVSEGTSGDINRKQLQGTHLLSSYESFQATLAAVYQQGFCPAPSMFLKKLRRSEEREASWSALCCFHPSFLGSAALSGNQHDSLIVLPGMLWYNQDWHMIVCRVRFQKKKKDPPLSCQSIIYKRELGCNDWQQLDTSNCFLPRSFVPCA